MDAQSSNTNQKICSSRKNPTLQTLFALESVSESDKILSLISHCTITFTFTDPSESPSQQELKRQNLVDLLCIIKASKKPLQHDQVLSPLMAMILANIFRPLPPPSNPSLVTIDTEFPEEEDPVSKLSRMWSHLQLVYELLLRPALAFPIRRPPGAGELKERIPPGILPVYPAPILHEEVDERRIPELRVRDRSEAQRDRGVARDMGKHNQRVHGAAERRAQAVPDEGANSAAQDEGNAGLPQAVGVLCVAVCAEGADAWRGRSEGDFEVLACHQLPKGDFTYWGIGGAC
ncbi:hypothetical protein TIFTF001_007465 [Ficus carica]|uniref:Uncharacterized protein n=1 Tax=Ficus carica TaxID=3494 RepID=A0AA87ZLB8_FICCA|nr:hypothetical protein TIFTF001_007465 [Ficus carica]